MNGDYLMFDKKAAIIFYTLAADTTLVGATPNLRLKSRLKCDWLSYPTSKLADDTLCRPVRSKSRAAIIRRSFWY